MNDRRVEGAAWAAADALFRDDPLWRGSDDAYSIPLDGDRTLWLFGDTFVARPGSPTREGSFFVRNTVAVQHGRDPLTATMEYAWRGEPDAPSDFFPPEGPGTGAEWFWPVHGVSADGRLLLFLMACDLPPGGDPHDPLGISFRVTGWRAFTVPNAAEPPSRWHLRPVLDRPEVPGTGVLGTAVLVEDGAAYLWSYDAGVAHLARVPAASAVAGDLRGVEWWTGGGWSPEHTRATVALDPALTEFTVHRLADGRLCLVDVTPLHGERAALHVRFAERPEGPWTEREPAYAIPEGARDDAFVYAGKAHPEQVCDGLAVTYASNGKDLAKLYRDESLYYPRWARLPL